MCKYNEDIYERDEFPLGGNFKPTRNYKRAGVSDTLSYNSIKGGDPLPESFIETGAAPVEKELKDFETISKTLEGL